VWAPLPARVELVLGEERIAMSRDDRGWWSADVDAKPGDDYAFSLDGGDPLPDPRSICQPDGVHGRSRLIDVSSFEWGDREWAGADLARSVVYELHVGTFTPEGTFEAAAARLGHLVDLGVDIVEVLPVNTFSGDRGWGYDGVDLYAVHPAYGGPEAFARFVDQCHERGLGVVLDVVYNHLGPAGNYLDRFGPYFTDKYKTPWGGAVNYDDAGSDEVRRFAIDNALVWLRDFHVDGLRLDAVHAITDTRATHLLEQLAVEVASLPGPPRFLIAESDLNDPRVVRDRDQGGYGVDAQWSDDFHHALHVALTGERDGYYGDFTGLDDLATALVDVFVYAGRHSAYRDRTHGRPVGDLPRTRFLGYAQNHDQVGNRAQGERLSQLVSTGRLRIAAALVLLGPFVPLLFMGEEWGASTPFQYFTSHEDPELAEAVRRGRRAEFAAFGWDPAAVPDPQAVETFERSKLDWSELAESPHAELLRWHRDLIALRRELALGPEPAAAEAHDQWLVMTRGPLRVEVDLDAETVAVYVDDEPRLSA
jgi:maltooligosyltrehalose trehalohydrolase